MHDAAREAMRLWQVWLVTFALLVAVYLIAPQQIGVVTYKAVFISLGGIMGYWLDRWTFPPIRHEAYDGRSAAMLRRAGLMAAAMLSFGLGA